MKGSSYLLLDVLREKLARLLSYFGCFLLFPVIVAISVGVLTQSATLGVKTFLLIELGMAILSPLLNAVIASGTRKTAPPPRKMICSD